MSCLLPHFKCQPDTFSIQFKGGFSAAPHIATAQRNRGHTFFQAQCVLSTTSTVSSTVVLDVEKLRLPSLEVKTDPSGSNRPWTYAGPVGQPAEANILTALATESLLASDEAVILAAAEEAVALAKAALKSAKDAAFMAKSIRSSKSRTLILNSSKVDTSLSKEAQNRILDQARLRKELMESEGTFIHDKDLDKYPATECEDLEPANEELDDLLEELSTSITVKSCRQIERKAKRAKAAEKSANSVVSVKAGSTSRRKRASSQDVDYSDPLRYLRGTTGSSRLLTSSEELELSAGIQVLLKLEKLQKDLVERCGGQPTFAQWAAAAGIDQKTLRHQLNYGVLCKDK